MYQSFTLTEDVDDLVEEHQLMGETSICVLGVVDLHVEVDPAACPTSMIHHESAGDEMSMLEHTMIAHRDMLRCMVGFRGVYCLAGRSHT